MNTAEIRHRFKNYYRELGFYPLPRAPMLHPSIPMSFVMSAGLVQIETSLSNLVERPSDRYFLIQECFRHFDLEKVGTDGIHLSLFEMPGGFVFGPNGKAETIRRMWTLAAGVLGLDQSRVWVSYFGGGKVMNDDQPADEETRATWVQLGIPQVRIVGLEAKDNYWVQGGGIEGRQVPRKCGPNTELFFDRDRDKACGVNCRPGCSCGRFVEFSNSLFICHELDSGGRLHTLTDPFAETVIGTERVAMILQSVQSVFGTDNYQPIMAAIQSFIHVPDVSEPLAIASERVIADHLKALYLLVSDGAPPPGKDGRERIIKLLIRGVVTRQVILGINSPEFLPTVLDCISRTVHSTLCATPEKMDLLQYYFSVEAQRFSNTIERGRRQLVLLLNVNNGHTLSGSQIVWLEKKQGLPHLLTAGILQDRGLEFRETEYEEALAAWKPPSHH